MPQVTAFGALRSGDDVRFRENGDRVCVDLSLTLYLPLVPGEAKETVFPLWCDWIAKAIAAAEAQKAVYDSPDKS